MIAILFSVMIAIDIANFPKSISAIDPDPMPQSHCRHIAALPTLGQIEHIAYSDKKNEIAVVGSRGAAVLQADSLAVLRIVAYSPPATPPSPYWTAVDLDADGEFEYVQAGGVSDAQAVPAYNADGKLRWKCDAPFKLPGDSGVHWVIPIGELGKPPVLFAGCDYSDEVYLIDHDGHVIDKQKWERISARQYTLELADLNGDKCNEILYASEKALIVRRNDGNVLFKATLEYGANSIIRAPFLDRDGTCAFYIQTSDRAAGKRQRGYYLVSDKEPHLHFLYEENSAPECSSCQFQLELEGMARKIWATPAVSEEPIPDTAATPGGIFLRLFDGDGKSLDKIAADTRERERGWHKSSVPAIKVRLKGSASDAILIAGEDTDLWLFEIIGGVARP